MRLLCRLSRLSYHLLQGLHFVLKHTCLIGRGRHSACRLAGCGLFWLVFVDFLLEAFEPLLRVVTLEGFGVHLWLYDLWGLWRCDLVSALAAASLLLSFCALFVVGESRRALTIGRASAVVKSSHPRGFGIWVIYWRLFIRILFIILIGVVEFIGVLKVRVVLFAGVALATFLAAATFDRHLPFFYLRSRRVLILPIFLVSNDCLWLVFLHALKFLLKRGYLYLILFLLLVGVNELLW